jgi:hypothetical protein
LSPATAKPCEIEYFTMQRNSRQIGVSEIFHGRLAASRHPIFGLEIDQDQGPVGERCDAGDDGPRQL